MLAREEIEGMYENHGLRPIMVLLGGSRYFKYNTASSDFDYFGYHFNTDDCVKCGKRNCKASRTKIPQQRCVTEEIVHVGNEDGVYITSRPIQCIIATLNSDSAYMVVYTLINWLCIEPVFEVDYSESCREHMVLSFFESNKKRVLECFESLIEDINNISIDENGEYDKKSNKWRQSLHITLVAHHLRKTGELICDSGKIQSIYNVDVEEVRSLKSLLAHL